MTTMADSTMLVLKTITAIVEATTTTIASLAAALSVTCALTLAFGAGAASAAGHSTEPPDLAKRKVAAMAPPAVATREMSTPVTGVLSTPDAASLDGHELHFQERVSGNLYTVRTEANGAFSTMLPQGVYDLRGMHGAVIARGVMVEQSPVNVGQVHPPGPYNIWRVLERQEIGEAIVKSPAPATAYTPNAGEAPAAIAVTPVTNPQVMGAGPGGKALAPAEVMPAQIEEQTELPSNAEVPAPGMPPAQDTVPGPSGGY
jgi:hypothetical protein